MKTDLEELKKALDIAGAGSILRQPEIDRVLAEIIERNNPLRQNLPRRGGSGEAYIWNRRTARGTAAFVNDTEEPTEQEGTYDQQSASYKTIFQRGKVTRKLQAQGKTLLDIEAEEIESALQSVRDKEDSAIIIGDAVSNAKEFSGLRKLVPGTQIITAGTNGAELTLKMLDDAVDLVIGQANMILIRKEMRRKLASLLQAQQRFRETVEVKGGFKLMSYEGIPIFPTIHQPTDEVQGTDSATQSLYVLETGPEVFMSVLTELTMERLAKKTSQGREFDVFMDESFVLKNELKVSRIKGLKTPT